MICCLVVGIVAGSQYNFCLKFGMDNSSLDIDVEWIMQGYNIGFQGFFVELLGLSSSLVNLLPQIRVVKSSFRKDFTESPFQNRTNFLNKELFSSEGKYIRSLTSDYMINPIEYSPWPADLGGIVDEADDLCGEAWAYEKDYAYAGAELAKHITILPSAAHCCRACVTHSLCLAWTFDASNMPLGTGTCSFKGRMDQSGFMSATATSGRMIVRPETTDATVETDSATTSSQVVRRRRPAPRVLIYHGTTCIHQNQSLNIMNRDINTVLIGRYMLERPYLVGGYNLDEYAVLHCAARMDELWVPTEWHKKIFQRLLTQQGSASSIPHITVIPEAVDTTLFRPDFVRTGPTRSIVGTDRDFLVDGTRTFNPDVDRIFVHKKCTFVGDDVECSGDHRFEFLSVFKWEYRKGWDVLLDAYWAAFKPTDAVLLRVRSYVPLTSGGDRNITRLMETHAINKLGKMLAELPAVVWENGAEGFSVKKAVVDNNVQGGYEEEVGSDTAGDSVVATQETALTREDMRDLLASANSFVLATRGEGWGLPVAEAMAMALPVIVTNHSGPAAFATADNSYLIPVLPELDSLSFAKPNVEALSVIMRQVVHDSSSAGDYAAQTKGLAARATMKHISPDSIVCKMNQRLRYHASIRGWKFP